MVSLPSVFSAFVEAVEAELYHAASANALEANPDAMRHILSMADVRTLGRAAQVRRGWRDAICGPGPESQALWRDRFPDEWPAAAAYLAGPSAAGGGGGGSIDARRLYRGLRRAKHSGLRVAHPWPPAPTIPRVDPELKGVTYLLEIYFEQRVLYAGAVWTTYALLTIGYMLPSPPLTVYPMYSISSTPAYNPNPLPGLARVRLCVVALAR